VNRVGFHGAITGRQRYAVTAFPKRWSRCPSSIGSASRPAHLAGSSLGRHRQSAPGGPSAPRDRSIATGGALGSILGQVLKKTGAERKTLPRRGAAAGMAATFGSPRGGITRRRLTLFFFTLRAAAALAHPGGAGGGRRLGCPHRLRRLPHRLAMPNSGSPMPRRSRGTCPRPLVGSFRLGVTRAVYAVEDEFEQLPRALAVVARIGASRWEYAAN